MDNETHVIKAGSTAHGQFETDVSIERAGWEWSSIRVLALPAGGSETSTRRRGPYVWSAGRVVGCVWTRYRWTTWHAL